VVFPSDKNVTQSATTQALFLLMYTLSLLSTSHLSFNFRQQQHQLLENLLHHIAKFVFSKKKEKKWM
jgi:hypothetical protein